MIANQLLDRGIVVHVGDIGETALPSFPVRPVEQRHSVHAVDAFGPGLFSRKLGSVAPHRFPTHQERHRTAPAHGKKIGNLKRHSAQVLVSG